MIRHNLLIAWRSALKDKSTLFINLIGLSSGLACALLIFMWVADELKVDKFHQKGDYIYQIRENVDQDHGLITRITTAGPTAAALAEEMPEVEMAVTATWVSDYTLSVDDKDLNADGIYGSRDFFQMFTYPLIDGSASEVLADKKSIVLSEGLAQSLFGHTNNLIGKTVEWQHEESFQIAGIFKDLPAAASTQFDFVLTFEGFMDRNEWVTNWFNTAPRTFVLLRDGTDLSAFNDKIENLVYEKTDGAANHRRPFATLYTDSYLYGKYENGKQSGGRITYVRLFSLIAIFILLIACINFMNLSTAQASKRVREIGIKKTLGATRPSLISQYLSESTMVAFMSLIMAIVMVLLSISPFNLLTGKSLSLSGNLWMFPFALILVFIVGLFSGSYPALYLTKFKPVAVLKGNLKTIAGEVWIRKGLVIFQFTLSIVLISAVWVVYKQMAFIQASNLGYKKDNIVLITREGKISESQETFLEAIKNIPGVTDASAIGHNLSGHNGGTYGVQWPGKDPEDRTEFERVPVDYGMIELLDIKMLEGRAFSKSFRTDTSKIIFNQAAIDYMGITDPVGKTVTLWGSEMEIVGICDDFHFDSFHESVKPLFMWLAPGNTRYIMARISGAQQGETLEKIKTFYQEFNPGYPFDYRFLDENYDNLYQAEQKVATLSKYFAGLAILISCLGLFGLAIYTSERRKKEIGIRKVLGSNEFGIVFLLSRDFTSMVLIAVLIAIPMSYMFATEWLQSFAFHIDLRWWYFLGAGALALVIAWLTVGIQTLKAAYVNPTECLRDE